MNQIIITDEEIQKENNTLELVSGDYRFEHLQNILNKGSGDDIRLTLINQGLGLGKILQGSKTSIQILLPSHWEQINLSKPRPSIHLCIGLSRPPTMKKIIEHATSMGVQQFSFFKGKLSERSYLNSKIWESKELNKLCDLGLSQSKIFYQRPKISLCPSLQSLPRTNNNFILDPSGISFSDIKKMPQEINLYIGPERGFTPDEVEMLVTEYQCQKIKISQSILRVEMATFYSLAQIEMLFF